jgi:sulfur relay (sulfurtransferase) DsrC/TusE family protein
MNKKSLIETNRYLQDSEKYSNSLITNVSSSTAIEISDSVWSIVDTVAEVVNSILIVPSPKQKSTSQ